MGMGFENLGGGYSMATTNDSVTDKFENALGELKLERLAALGEAIGVQVAMQSLLQHEAQRIESKLGPQHPRTQRLKAGVQSNLQLALTLEVERQLVRIDVPEVAEEGALVHGRIVDEDDLGIEGLTVCLVDRSGESARETGESKSDGSGYFAIALHPETVDRLIKRYPDEIFLAVFTARRRLLHRQPKPLSLARGARLLVKVQLSRKDLTTTPSEPPATVVAPNLVGLTESEAMTVLQGAGLQLGERTTKATPDYVGRVLDQSPTAGSKLVPGSSVSLVIAVEETETVQVPNLVGITLKAAKKKIKTARLKLGTVSGHSPTDESIVARQEPLQDAEVPIGTLVNLAVRRADV